MPSKYLIGLCALSLAACANNSENLVTTVGAESTASAANISDATIETCWLQAGLNGDLYRFLSPSEALGLRTVGGSSDAQIAQFKACLVA